MDRCYPEAHQCEHILVRIINPKHVRRRVGQMVAAIEKYLDGIKARVENDNLRAEQEGGEDVVSARLT